MEITVDLIQDILKEYPRIQSLDFSYNLLQHISSLELSKDTLIALNLQHNKIDFHVSRGVPNSLPFLVKLVQLDLSFNQISNLKNSGIENLRALQEFDVSHN